MNRNNCEIAKKTLRLGGQLIPLSILCAGDPLWVQYDRGIVVDKACMPRSCLVQTATTCLRRIQRHLVPTPNLTLEPMLPENRVIEVSDVVQSSETSSSVVCTSPVPHL